MKKILIYIAHPRSVHVLRGTIKILRLKGYKIRLLIKSKDVLEELLINDNEPYHNILKK